jgi:cytosine/adenosine deaminase-related metal-dependent hydrolase
MPYVHHARWILPIAQPPIRDGWVAVDAGRIVALGGASDAPPLGLADARATHLRAARFDGQVGPPDTAILPGLVNAHTHLELSYLHGRVPPRDRFSEWIRDVVAMQRRYPDRAAPEIVMAAREAIRFARAAGTALFGDISNTLATVPLLRDAGVRAQVFYELLGFNVPDPEVRVAAARRQANEANDASAGDDVRVTLAPHAPYSVSPPLFAAIRADLDSRTRRVSSVHLGESPDEVEFVRHGTGDIRATLEQLGVWTDEWRAVLPSGLSPVGYLSTLGFLDGSILVIHGVQFDDEDLERLRALGATLVSCPRSNRHVGAGDPPLERFYESGVRIAVGTDSLASVEDLNVFAELAAMRRLAPSVPAARLLESATKHGADALGFGGELGTIEPGKRAELIAVRLPGDVVDVEEFLVSGITPHDVGWLG